MPTFVTSEGKPLSESLSRPKHLDHAPIFLKRETQNTEIDKEMNFRRSEKLKMINKFGLIYT